MQCWQCNPNGLNHGSQQYCCCTACKMSPAGQSSLSWQCISLLSASIGSAHLPCGLLSATLLVHRCETAGQPGLPAWLCPLGAEQWRHDLPDEGRWHQHFDAGHPCTPAGETRVTASVLHCQSAVCCPLFGTVTCEAWLGMRTTLTGGHHYYVLLALPSLGSQTSACRQHCHQLALLDLAALCRLLSSLLDTTA